MKIVHGFNLDNDTQAFLFLLDIRSQYMLYLSPTKNNKVKYDFVKLNREGNRDYSVFTGEDYRPSPLHDPLGLDSAIGLLCNLTLKPGDTDSEYFNDYTGLQMEWTQSLDCEEMSIVVSDYENKDLEYIDILDLSELL